MARLLSRDPEQKADDPRGPDALRVAGVRYDNTAAKFWAGLVDEIHRDFPACDAIEFRVPATEPLDHKHLFPEIAFQEDLERLLGADLEAAMREAFAELDVMGPPAAVRVRLLKGDSELLAGALPTDAVDAEIFPCLIVWLLHWAEIPEFLWNNSPLTGNFAADDPASGRGYRFTFTLARQDLKEDLFERVLSVGCNVQKPGGT